jgi:hypothetical protein
VRSDREKPAGVGLRRRSVLLCVVEGSLARGISCSRGKWAINDGSGECCKSLSDYRVRRMRDQVKLW